MTAIRIILLAASILAAIFAEKLDQMTNSCGKLRKVILISCAGVILITLISIVSKTMVIIQ